jgi:hypothetical protein
MGKKNTKRHRNGSDFCEASGKRRYRDPRQATRALQSLQNRAGALDEQGRAHTIHQKRKYRCDACRGWHLTSWATPGAQHGDPETSGPRRDPLVTNLARATGLTAPYPHAMAARIVRLGSLVRTYGK